MLLAAMSRKQNLARLFIIVEFACIPRIRRRGSGRPIQAGLAMRAFPADTPFSSSMAR